jgi:hypothetical protein
MTLGDDLSLDLNLLDEGTDQTLFEDIVIPDDNSQPEIKKTEVSQPQPKTSSEKPNVSESVAGEEEKAKSPEKKADTSISSPDSDNDKLSEVYSSLATHLHKSGVLSSLNTEKPVKSFADLQEAIKSEITNGLDEITKSYKEAMERGVPQDEFVQYERTMQQLNSITPEVLADDNNSELRFKVLAQDFLNRNFTREEAERYAKRSVDLGEDVEDAKKAIENIKSFTKVQFEQKEKEIKEREEKVNTDLKQFIDKTTEVIDGIKLDDNQKEKLFKQITTPIARDKDGKVLSKYGKALTDDPVKMKVITEYLFMITDGFSDFSKLNTTIETGKTKELDEILKSSVSTFSQDGSYTSQIDNESKFLTGDFEIDV